MSAQADEPPMLSTPPGQLREWVQLALLLADMIARRRERLGREAWSEERDAERALDRAGRARNLRLATEEERTRHLAAGRWQVAGRSADRPQAQVTTAISRVDDRWVIHAIGHRGPPVGDLEVWLSCPSREHAMRIATALLARDDPERVERLRDELQADEDRVARTVHPGWDDVSARANADRSSSTASGSERSEGRGTSRSRNGGGDEAHAATTAMESELRSVFDRASADAVCTDLRWPSVVREMLDAQAAGHNVASMLHAARSRLPQPLSDRSHYRSPAAYLFALLRKERDRMNGGDYIDMPVTQPRPRTAEPREQADASHSATARSDRQSRRGASGGRGTPRNAGASPEVVTGVLEWIEGLDSEDDLDRSLAEDTVGRYGRRVDQALGEKFPGLLSPHRAAAPSSGGSGAEESAERGGDVTAEAAVADAQGRGWRARERDDRVDVEAADAAADFQFVERSGGTTDVADVEAVGEARVDAHRAAAEHAAALEAEGREGAAVARASVSATPSQAASDAADMRQEGHGDESSSSPNRTAAAGRSAPRPSPFPRTPSSPGQRPPGR